MKCFVKVPKPVVEVITNILHWNLAMTTKNNDKEQFSLISMVVSYIYLKEKYPRLKIPEEQKDSDIENLTEEIRKLDRYAHLPNKLLLIKEKYEYIAEKAKEPFFDEEAFLALIRNSAAQMDASDKDNILQCLVFFANNDNKISEKEREVISQLAEALGIKKDFNKILDVSLGKKTNKITPIALVVALIGLIAGSGFYMYSNAAGEIEVFDRRDVVFGEVYFNRFIVYQNRFDVNNQKMRKQAVFFMNGSAEIAFKPGQLARNSEQGKVTLSYEGITPFHLKLHFFEPLEVDKVDPQPISEEEAKNVGAVVGIVSGIAGAVGGAKAGALLGNLLPLPYQVVAQVAGGAVGGLGAGAVGYFATSSALEGMKISEALSPGETREITDAAKELIKGALIAEPELADLYKEKFEIYIKEKYAGKGIRITQVDYQELK